MACSMAVKISNLNRCTQKSRSSSDAMTLRISHPAARLSRLASVRVSVRMMWTTCSLRSSLRHLSSWTMLLTAEAAVPLALGSELRRSLMTGRMRFSRRAMSSGSVGGLTALMAIGSARWPFALLRRDLPMLSASSGWLGLGLGRTELDSKVYPKRGGRRE